MTLFSLIPSDLNVTTCLWLVVNSGLYQCVFSLPQGTVFDLVIQEVCDASQVDFEESGVDQQTLLDLRQVCFRPWSAGTSREGECGEAGGESPPFEGLL